jgi:hypothetical protein
VTAATKLVIGASGFLGSHVTRLLVENGERVRVLLRTTSSTKAIDDLDVDRRYGDIFDDQALREAMRGCDDVYYCVVDARAWVRDPTPLFRTNVEGLRHVLDAAVDSGDLRRFVFTSTIGTIAISEDGGPVARALILAADNGRVGQRYIISERFITGDMVLSTLTVRLLHIMSSMDHSKAQRELGWQPKPIHDSVRRAVDFIELRVSLDDRRRRARCYLREHRRRRREPGVAQCGRHPTADGTLTVENRRHAGGDSRLTVMRDRRQPEMDALRQTTEGQRVVGIDEMQPGRAPVGQRAGYVGRHGSAREGGERLVIDEKLCFPHPDELLAVVSPFVHSQTRTAVDGIAAVAPKEHGDVVGKCFGLVGHIGHDDRRRPHRARSVLAAAEKQRAGARHQVILLSHHRIDELNATTVTDLDGFDPQRSEAHRPEQVDSEPGGLQVGIGDVMFDGATEQSADEVTA